MRRTLLVVAAALMSAVSLPRAQAEAKRAASPNNASYRLTASLDPGSHTITGSGRLTWRNISRNPTSELRFHLYWNAWRDPGSSWLREQRLGRNAALANRPADDRGSIDVTTIQIGGVNLAERSRFIAPDDGNDQDKTVLSVPLDHPVAPDQTIEIDLAWTSRVPRTYARTGRIGDYYFVGQWFPKIGVLEDSGWNCHQFHAATEFFSDFGTYDVTLNVPAGWVVGATGRAIEETADRSGRRVRFLQSDVHDFAWTTSPSFLRREERFAEPGLPPVNMILLLQPEHADQADRHFAATRAALKYYGTWFGFYGYDQITVVDPVTIVDAAAQGESTGGMEYPTLFTAGTRWRVAAAGTQPESVTVHEAGHQFWYGMVATNEFEHAWMDEGFNTYSTARTMDAAFPGKFVAVDRFFGGLLPWAFTDVRWSREIDGNRLNAYRPVAGNDRQSTPTWQYWPGSASAITYNKTALWLATLERMVGWPMMQQILSTHFARGAFRHPSPEEFFALANEISGRDLTWFFDAVHRSAATFDYGVTDVLSTPRGGTIDHQVIVRRFGDGVFPVATRVTFADGSGADLTWDGRDPWHSFTLSKSSAIARVQVDPDRVLLLDVNYTNNSWSAAPMRTQAARKWALRWLTWLQELLLTHACFA
ncbi:MAG TPA: M1 family metallopeptidase [Vicinamibacterales bacterium]|nr:M1 family metallopeptidase [Vicinamibacterales bacterium]